MSAGSSFDGQSAGENISAKDDLENDGKRDLTKVFDKKICGHIFSSSSNKAGNLKGMLYRSRLKQFQQDMHDAEMDATKSELGFSTTPREDADEMDKDVAEDASDCTDKMSVGQRDSKLANHLRSSDFPSLQQDSFEDESESDDDAGELLNNAQRMAHTLNNWCRTETNMQHMIKEQGVKVLVLLSQKGQEDFNILKYCVSAFHRISRVAKHRRALLEGGAVNALLSLSNGCMQFRHTGVARLCAGALVNLSLFGGGERTVAEDGGSYALINNLMPLNEAKLAPLCLQGLFNLSCVKESQWHEKSIEKVLRSLLSVTQSEKIDSREIVAKGLCNCSQFLKLRLKMLDEGAVRVLSNILCPTRKNKEEPLPLDNDSKYAAMMALYRMAAARICRAEMVSKGIMKVLRELAMQETEGRVMLCLAATLQNLAQDSNSKLRMVKEGALLVVSHVLERTIINSRNGTSPSHSFKNQPRGAKFLRGSSNSVLPGSPQYTPENECLEVYKLLSSTLHHLSKEHACISPMVSVPRRQEGRSSYVNELERSRGAIPCLVDLCQEGDQTTHANCLYTFCHMLLEPEANKHMLSTNAMKILLELIDTYNDENDDYSLMLSYALYHICKITSSHEQIMGLGIVRTLVRFCVEEGMADTVQEECASALGLLSYQESIEDASVTTVDEVSSPEIEKNPIRNQSLSNADSSALLISQRAFDKVQHVVERGAVQALVSLLTQYAPPKQVALQATVCLAILAHDQHHTQHFLDGETITAVADAALEKHTELQTIQASCSFLASLSFHPKARALMVENKIVDTLLKLATMDDKRVQRHCATCFCNLSVEEQHRGLMVGKGVVPKLSEISNSYNEETQEDCARCLCNLSCHAGTIITMVNQGAVHALMMIVMVRSVQEVTKHLCAKALLNLMDDSSMSFLLKEGVVQAFAELAASQTNEDTLEICAKALCMFSCFPGGRRKLTERKRTMEGLFALTHSSRIETKNDCCKAVCNLVMFSESCERAGATGALGVLKVLATLPLPSDDPISLDIQTRVPYAMAIMVENEAARIMMTKEDAVGILIYLTRSLEEEVVVAAVRALTCFAYHKTMRKPMVKAGACGALAQLILRLDQKQDWVALLREDMARALCYMSVPIPNRSMMCIEHGVVAVVVLARRSAQIPVVEALTALTLQYLSWSIRSQPTLLTEGGVQLLIELVFKQERANKPLGTDLEIARDCITVCANLSTREEFRLPLVQLRAVEAMSHIVSLKEAEGRETVRSIIRFIWYLSLSKELVTAIVQQGATHVLVALGLGPYANLGGKQMIAKALCALSKSRKNRAKMVEQDAIKCLLELAEDENSVTKRMCAVTLTNLSAYAKLEGSTLMTQLKLYSDHGNAPAVPARSFAERTEIGEKCRKARDTLRTLILTGVFVTQAIKHAPGVFHTDYTDKDALNIYRNIDILPPTSIQELKIYQDEERKLSHITTPPPNGADDDDASVVSFQFISSEAANGLSKASFIIVQADGQELADGRNLPRYMSFYGGMIFETSVTHTVLHIRTDAGVAATKVARQIPVPPKSLTTGARVERNPGEDEEGGYTKEGYTRELISLYFPKLTHPPIIEIMGNNTMSMDDLEASGRIPGGGEVDTDTDSDSENLSDSEILRAQNISKTKFVSTGKMLADAVDFMHNSRHTSGGEWEHSEILPNSGNIEKDIALPKLVPSASYLNAKIENEHIVNHNRSSGHGHSKPPSKSISSKPHPK